MKTRDYHQLGGTAVVVATVMFISSWSGLKTSAAPSGETVFKNNCVTCHAGGKNTIEPKKPIIGSKKLESKEVFKTYISKGGGAMPPLPQVANDDEALQALFIYCKSLK
jgi:mono/diheme cytochrome c family protein